jgi:hypothetical protein
MVTTAHEESEVSKRAKRLQTSVLVRYFMAVGWGSRFFTCQIQSPN